MAGRFTVETIFSAQDRLTAPVRKMERSTKRMLDKTTRGLKSVNRGLNSFIGGIGRAARRMATFGAGVALAGITAATVALKGLADTADEMAKRSRRLQFPIEDLQKYAFVAEQSGFTSDKFNSALDKLGRTVGEAKSQTGSLFTILKKNDAATLRALKGTNNLADAYDIIIEKIRATADPTEKLAIASAAFGRAGQGIVNIAEQSDEAIAGMMAQMERNGIVTQEQANNAEAFNDSLNSLKLSLIGTLRGALFPMLPILTEYADRFREFSLLHRSTIQNRVKQFFTVARDKVVELYKAARKFWKEYELTDRFKETLGQAGRFISFMSENTHVIGKLAKTVAVLTIAFKVLTVAALAVVAVSMASPLGLIALAVGGVGVAVAALVIWWDDLTSVFKGAIPWFERTGASLDNLFKRIGAQVTRYLDNPLQAVIDVITFLTAKLGQLRDLAGLPVRIAVQEAQTNVFAGQQFAPAFAPTQAPAAQAAAAAPTQAAPNAGAQANGILKIQDETGRATVENGTLGDNVQLIQSGAF